MGQAICESNDAKLKMKYHSNASQKLNPPNSRGVLKPLSTHEYINSSMKNIILCLRYDNITRQVDKLFCIHTNLTLSTGPNEEK